MTTKFAPLRGFDCHVYSYLSSKGRQAVTSQDPPAFALALLSSDKERCVAAAGGAALPAAAAYGLRLAMVRIVRSGLARLRTDRSVLLGHTGLVFTRTAGLGPDRTIKRVWTKGEGGPRLGTGGAGAADARTAPQNRVLAQEAKGRKGGCGRTDGTIKKGLDEGSRRGRGGGRTDSIVSKA